VKTVRATITLPADLIEETDEAVRKCGTESRSKFVERALRKELKALRNAAIDEQIRAAYASLTADEIEEMRQWAEDGLDDTLRYIRQVEAGE
jgi:metal-responsive CopG/Arc/MetJ family transcriptional regulator